jgi:hypothetical protein
VQRNEPEKALLRRDVPGRCVGKRRLVAPRGMRREDVAEPAIAWTVWAGTKGDPWAAELRCVVQPWSCYPQKAGQVCAYRADDVLSNVGAEYLVERFAREFDAGYAVLTNGAAFSLRLDRRWEWGEVKAATAEALRRAASPLGREP